jgi:hypothetical protein
MKKPTTSQLDAYLERMIRRAGKLSQLNLSAESGLREALEESQNLLANLAMYRHLLKHMAQQQPA